MEIPLPTCPRCNGKQTVPDYEATIFTFGGPPPWIMKLCPDCSGTGLQLKPPEPTSDQDFLPQQ
jgi:hypothetical protein